MTDLSRPSSRFDPFLFASLFEQEGQSVSVLSTLARLDVDPWQEAARLAQLPRDYAINSLAATIWKSNSERWSPSEASILAARLIELLPRGQSPSNTVSTAAMEAAGIESLVMMWVIYAIVWGSIASGSNTSPNSTSYGEPSSIVNTIVP